MTRLRTGITTGTCAAAAAKAAAMILIGRPSPESVDLTLPDGQILTVPILYARPDSADRVACPQPARPVAGCRSRGHEPESGDPMPRQTAAWACHPREPSRQEVSGTPVSRAVAAVRKDAGDDPDVTDGLTVVVTVGPATGDETEFLAGDGVGTVTKPGLQVPPGQPAINPVPRRMIAAAVAEVTDRPLTVEVAIPGGREVAARTFNPRLGVVGGLSILGTTGVVRPYLRKAVEDSLRCALDVAAACGVRRPVLVPGHIGERAARSHFALADEQLIEVGNEWGYVLGLLGGYPFEAALVAGHPGKLAKLAAGEWDTHSARSAGVAEALGALCGAVLGRPAPESPTAEGVFAALEPPDRRRLADALAARIRAAVERKVGDASGGSAQGWHGHAPLRDREPPAQARTRSRKQPRDRATPVTNALRGGSMTVAVVVINMAGDVLGSDGDLSPWR